MKTITMTYQEQLFAKIDVRDPPKPIEQPAIEVTVKHLNNETLAKLLANAEDKLAELRQKRETAGVTLGDKSMMEFYKNQIYQFKVEISARAEEEIRNEPVEITLTENDEFFCACGKPYSECKMRNT